MAAGDNITITQGVGTTLSTNDIGGVHVQRMKVQWGADGVATDVSAASPMPVTVGTALPAGTNKIGAFTLQDASTSNQATLAVFHNSDNQAVGGSAYGLLTGGVAQLVNAAGNLDRQRETSVDGIAQSGIATGTQQLASSFSTTITANISTGSQTVTPAAMSGTSRGAPWSIQVGSILTVANSNGTNKENVLVTAVSTTTFTATFATTKTGPGITVAGFVYNQARDATAADGSTGQGFNAGATFLFNSTLNSGSGGWEAARSASGELDGASGTGTSLAVEYKFNGTAYDRGRSLQGKGLATTTLTSTATAPTTSLALASVTGILPGQPLWLLGGTPEQVYVSSSYVPSTGAGTVTLASATANTHNSATNVQFEVFSYNGPGTNGFYPTGINISEEALWDPVSGLYYVERSSTQDGVSGQNVSMVGPALYNGSTLDRQHNNIQGTVLASAARTATTTSSTINNNNARGVIVFLNVTVASGTGGLTLRVQGVDPVSGSAVNLNSAPTAVTATGLTAYQVFPGVSGGGLTQVTSAALPRVWQVTVTAGDTSSYTYSVGYSYTL